MSIQRMKLTGAAILVSRGTMVLQAAPAAYPYRSAAWEVDVATAFAPVWKGRYEAEREVYQELLASDPFEHWATLRLPESAAQDWLVYARCSTRLTPSMPMIPTSSSQRRGSTSTAPYSKASPTLSIRRLAGFSRSRISVRRHRRRCG